MADVDPATWGPWIYFLYGFAIYCAVGLVWFWFRFHALEHQAHQTGDVEAFNRALKGWPNVVYAKMLGKRQLEPERRSPWRRRGGAP